jgi:hypothetical protein
MGTGTLPAGTTTPIGTSGTLTAPGGLPARNVDGGTLTPGQPMNTPGSQPVRRANGRTRTTTPTGTAPRQY